MWFKSWFCCVASTNKTLESDLTNTLLAQEWAQNKIIYKTSPKATCWELMWYECL